MIKSRLSYFFVDPSCGGYSASRLASLVMVFVDALWAAVVVLGLPPKESFTPVSSMLGTATIAAFAAYGVSTGVGAGVSAWKAAGEIASTVFRKTTVTKEEGVRGEEEKKTTTVTSQVDSGPKDKVVPAPAKAAQPQGD